MPTIIKNGRNYSGTSVSLTQAEYDALPEVTKMNGTTYFITDSEVVLNAEDVALDEGNLNDLAGSVATIETSPATANHEVGEYILWNGVLYTVTSAIATGENLVINSNISVRTIGSELTALNNDLIKYVDVQVTCNAATWQMLNLPNGISSDRVINVTRRNGTSFYGCLWWKSDSSSLRFLRINTSGTNLVLNDTAGDVTVRVFYY